MSAKDPESHLLFVMSGFLAYLALPIVFGTALYLALTLGAFPPEADAIAIPFAGFLMVWISGLLFAFVLGAIGVSRELRKR
jgi:hypothetical protein